jgi:hypothetical protein
MMELEWLEDMQNVDVHVRRTYKGHFDPLVDLCHEEFKYRYRLNKDTVRQVISQVEPFLQQAVQNKYCNISPTLQVLITLRFYSGATFQTICGDLFSVSQSSVSRSIERVTDALLSLRGSVIRFPMDKLPTKQKFLISPISLVLLEYIDGTHIPISKPRGHPNPELFRCRKGYFSVNAQVVAGPDNKFYDVVARWPGSTHDSRIFSNSYLSSKFRRGDFGADILLGDAGYPCIP